MPKLEENFYKVYQVSQTGEEHFCGQAFRIKEPGANSRLVSAAHVVLTETGQQRLIRVRSLKDDSLVTSPQFMKTGTQDIAEATLAGVSEGLVVGSDHDLLDSLLLKVGRI